jgi:glucose/arabinose dehydrogenase
MLAIDLDPLSLTDYGDDNYYDAFVDEVGPPEQTVVDASTFAGLPWCTTITEEEEEEEENGACECDTANNFLAMQYCDEKICDDCHWVNDRGNPCPTCDHV